MKRYQLKFNFYHKPKYLRNKQKQQPRIIYELNDNKPKAWIFKSHTYRIYLSTDTILHAPVFDTMNVEQKDLLYAIAYGPSIPITTPCILHTYLAFHKLMKTYNSNRNLSTVTMPIIVCMGLVDAKRSPLIST